MDDQAINETKKTAIQAAIKDSLDIARSVKPSRNMALVITKLEEAEDRILRAINED